MRRIVFLVLLSVFSAPAVWAEEGVFCDDYGTCEGTYLGQRVDVERDDYGGIKGTWGGREVALESDGYGKLEGFVGGKKAEMGAVSFFQSLLKDANEVEERDLYEEDLLGGGEDEYEMDEEYEEAEGEEALEGEEINL